MALRILCFGDSLTAGYARWGSVYHPYARAVSAALQAGFPDLDLRIQDDGVPGELAIADDFIGRMREQYCDTAWDWAIVLGGTNDLGYATSPKKTFDALAATWRVALESGKSVLALTVPECSTRTATLDASRDELNAMIMGFKHERFHAFDLKAAIPYHSLTEAEQDKYWDDGLHLTPAGYDWMGGHIAEALIPLLSTQAPTS